jgi:hypothetical protein
MNADGLLAVRRAARKEAALPTHHAGQRDPVQADGRDQEEPERGPGQPHPTPEAAAHGRNASTRRRSSRISASRSCVFAPWMLSRATNTMSRFPWIDVLSSRHAARMILRARLRATAPPTRRLATNATSVGPARGATYSITRAPARDVPDRRTPRTSVRLRRQARAALGPASGEDGAAGPGAHPDAEAVRLLAPANVRLERLFHGVAGEYSGVQMAVTGPVLGKKCVKTRERLFARAEAGATIRAASPGPGPTSPREIVVPHTVERCCG